MIESCSSLDLEGVQAAHLAQPREVEGVPQPKALLPQHHGCRRPNALLQPFRPSAALAEQGRWPKKVLRQLVQRDRTSSDARLCTIEYMSYFNKLY